MHKLKVITHFRWVAEIRRCVALHKCVKHLITINSRCNSVIQLVRWCGSGPTWFYQKTQKLERIETKSTKKISSALSNLDRVVLVEAVQVCACSDIEWNAGRSEGQKLEVQWADAVWRRLLFSPWNFRIDEFTGIARYVDQSGYSRRRLSGFRSQTSAIRSLGSAVVRYYCRVAKVFSGTFKIDVLSFYSDIANSANLTLNWGCRFSIMIWNILIG